MSDIRKVISEMRSVRTSVSVMDWADRIEAALTGDVYKQFITDASIEIREKPRHVGMLPALGAGYWDNNVLPRLYLDLDGVMADFDGDFPAVFGIDHRSLADEEMWARINCHASFFRDLPLMPGALDFYDSIKHLQPTILTACPKTNYAHVAGQKRAWVREHLSPDATVLPVLGGYNKPLFMHSPGDILIDDWGKNCDAWRKAGGVAIKHEGDFAVTATALKQAMFK